MIYIKKETRKIANLLNDPYNKSSKFATRKWYVINDQNNGKHGRGNENDSTIKFETKDIKPNLYDCSDAYILVTGGIKIENIAADTNVACKNCAPFTRCITHTNDESRVLWGLSGTKRVGLFKFLTTLKVLIPLKLPYTNF